MRAILNILTTLISIYSVLIFIRILLSWFGEFASGKVVKILCNITDPYLDWWRRNLNLRIGFLDFSAVAAVVSLAFIQNVLFTLSISERMTLGFILAQIVVSIWRIISFIIGFFMVIIVLRGVAYLTNRNVYSPFWGAVDSISQPLMYRMNRIIFGNRIGGYLNGIIISFLILAAIMFGGRLIINLLAGFLYNLPL